MKKLILLIASSAFAIGLFAQPTPFGCDHKHHLVKPKPMTDAEKSFMNASIARSDTFDIVHYDINLDVTNYNGSFLNAHTTITYAALMDNVTVLNFDLRQLTVDSVKQGGVSLPFAHVNELLSIQLPSPSVTGEQNALTVWYQGQPYKDPEWGGFYFASGYIYNLGIGISTIPPNFGKVWYPCFDSFVERATYEYHVHTASDKVAYCQGLLAGRDTLDDESIISHYLFNYPIPTHLSAIAASNYILSESTHTGLEAEIPVSLVCKPQDMTAMLTKFQYLGYAIDALEHWYGPYYYGRVGYVLTTDGALEIPENIAYPQFMMTQAQASNDRLLAHELGHHWWGDMVAPALHNHMWLKEGPAEYSAHLMTEWKDGRDAMITQVKNNQAYVLETAHVDDDGFWQLSPIPDPQIYGRHTYYKGASVVHNLRGYLGDELYRTGMQAVLAEKLNDSMYPEEFRDILSAATGVNLTSFFNDWVFSPGFSTFVLDSAVTSPSGENFNTVLHIHQKLREAPQMHTNVPLEMTAYDDQWQKHNFTATLSGEFSSAAFTTPFEPLFWELNGNGILNQSRLDYNKVYSTTTGLTTLPFVDFRLQVNSITDSALVRVEHQWAAPDNDDMVPWLAQLSSTHFWTVDGIWPADLSLTGRVTYTGVQTHNLDHDLVSDTEEFITLAYRKDASETWTTYPHQTIVPGNLFNANGYIKIDSLLKGQYAFARTDPNVKVPEVAAFNFLLYPNPADDKLWVKSDFLKTINQVNVSDMQGRIVATFSRTDFGSGYLPVGSLSNGVYLFSFYDENGFPAENQKVIVRH